MNKQLFTLLPVLFFSGAAVADICDNENEVTPIAQIQGENEQSSLIDQQVTVRGIVTASWQTDEQLSGFFIHSFAEDMDDNP
ncbi:MAG TPA: nuclease, partial [Idiomarina abyssalis]|nr:nuclease [Idiomarina abyssalis]